MYDSVPWSTLTGFKKDMFTGYVFRIRCETVSTAVFNSAKVWFMFCVNVGLGSDG